uniref:Putative ovule protein n=1 Tax=Solanum chacoense TaxID=4108 RepID=A0A0V0GQ90_SOLCH
MYQKDRRQDYLHLSSKNTGVYQNAFSYLNQTGQNFQGQRTRFYNQWSLYVASNLKKKMEHSNLSGQTTFPFLLLSNKSHAQDHEVGKSGTHQSH